MNGEKYRVMREKVGSQAHVAEVLGINKQTISNRERGIYNIGKEAAWAMTHLVQVKRGIINRVGTVAK